MLDITITSPEECFVETTATHISLPGVDGDFEIHPNHCAFISLLKTGSVVVHSTNSEPIILCIDSGIVEVSQNCISVLVDSAHKARESEQAKFESDQRQYRRDLQNVDKVNYHTLLKQLTQLSAELRTIEKSRKYLKKH